LKRSEGVGMERGGEREPDWSGGVGVERGME